MEESYKNQDWLYEKVVVEGKTYSEIARLFSVKTPTIAYFAKKFSIVRPLSTKKPDNMERAAKCRDINWLTHQYLELDKSYDDISKEFSIGKTTVARWVKRHGLAKDSIPQHRRKNNFPPVLVSCEHCQKQTLQKYSKVANGYGRFCSQSCATKFLLKTTDLSHKLKEGHFKFFATEEGKELRHANGVKASIYTGKRTSIEIAMARELSARGVKYIEQFNLGNKFALDFFLPEYGIVIECDGDYWHRLPQNMARDKAKNAYVKACGFSLYRFWECEINTDVEVCVDVVMAEINEKVC